MYKITLGIFLSMLTSAAFFGHSVAAEKATATQRILPEECVFSVVNPETQELYFHNPEVCEPQPEQPPQQTPPQQSQQPGSNGTDNDSGTGESQDSLPPAAGITTPPSPDNTGTGGILRTITVSIGGLLTKSSELLLFVAWLASWVAAISLTIVMLVVIAFGGAGLSKLVALSAAAVSHLPRFGR